MELNGNKMLAHSTVQGQTDMVQRASGIGIMGRGNGGFDTAARMKNGDLLFKGPLGCEYYKEEHSKKRCAKLTVH
ncbi:hypothetical protein G9P44_002689 [Scheffersomyces stipitis]|nr:hypothetical protein G9P44_002689 [Scheffersomyces stipitis]